jgi:hypothetical protein
VGYLSAVMDDNGTLSPVEEGWLHYARDVVGDLEHRRQCAGLGGSPDHPGVDAIDLRWPGYLGERATPGRTILCVGAVHREFASGSLRPHHRDRLVEATRAWAAGRLDRAQCAGVVHDGPKGSPPKRPARA